jgi:hypothetical protein
VVGAGAVIHGSEARATAPGSSKAPGGVAQTCHVSTEDRC